MMQLNDVVKKYHTRSGSKLVLDKVNFRLEKGEKVGILGQNGAGKSTLIRLISGVEPPSSGKITRTMRISWPLAFGGAFQGSLSGLDNVRFVCRIYEVDYQRARAFVEEFSELGDYLREPVKSYSSGMRARLAFAISLAVEFDCYLIDEIIAVGDARFRKKCQTELFEKRVDRAMILVSHSANTIRKHCERAVVLHQGKIHSFPTLDETYQFYDELMK